MTGIVASIVPIKTPLTHDLLIVAGGGGGSSRINFGSGSGGGGGGFRNFQKVPIVTGNFTVTVGAGGGINTNGTNSVFGSLQSSGGGGGTTLGSGDPGGPGGNGGGMKTNSENQTVAWSGNTGGYSPVEGYPSGTSIPNVTTITGGGGSGGTMTQAQATGGIGAISTITGASVYYSGGGGAGYFDNGTSGGAGGLGGGGSGALSTVAAQTATPGTANTGGGGGGGNLKSTPPQFFGTSAPGGSGIIISAIPTSASLQLQVGPGLTYSVDTTSRPGVRIVTFTAGTGTCYWG